MRTYGRVTDPITRARRWVEVVTDESGHDDRVWLTTLIQVLQLTPGESPFYANHGIPAQQTIIQQVMPDYYVARTQAQFAGRFASLIVARVRAYPPTYRLNVVLTAGTKFVEDVAL